MTPEEKSLLERTYKLSEENNEILRKMRRTSRWSLILRVIYWIIILGAAYGAYYFIQPYVETALGVFKEANQVIGGTNDSISQAQNSLSSLKDYFK